MNRGWLAMIAGALLLAACGRAADPVPERPTPTPEVSASVQAGSRTVRDMAGRSIMVPDSVRRVVALSPSAADFAAALELEVVGRSNDTAEAVSPGAQPVGAAISPDFNAVAALQPDLVLADAAYHSGRTRDFDRFAYPVFILKAATYEGVLEAITALGDATNAIDRAAEVRAELEARAGLLSDSGNARASREGKVRVLILTGGGRDIFAGGESTYLGSLVRLLGAENVLGDTPEGGPITGFGVVEVGTAASLNPDVVFILPSGQGGLLEHLMSRTSWANTPAVRESRIHNLDTALFLRSPGPRAGEALETLYQLLWP